MFPGKRERLDQAVYTVRLDLDLSEIRKEKPFRARGHNSRILVKHKGFALALLVMKSRAHIPEHAARAAAVLHVLSGTVRVHLPGNDRVLKAGELVSVDRKIRHDLTALSDASLLVTLVR